MVFLDNVRQFFADHSDVYGSDPQIPMAEFLTAVSAEALDDSKSPPLADDPERYIRTTIVTSGEVKHIFGKERFELFASDLELPQHRAILRRAFEPPRSG